ncbi:MAG: ATP-binding cassette domain-containing protein [Ottowia sp.]|nr:ATP-binding cassette domain-containing protein [Ottowia sp.]
MIRIENLHKTYQVEGRTITALDNINLTIHQGEIFGIIGRSGAGKSSLIRTLNLLEHPSQGRIFIEDTDITRLDQQAVRLLRQRIGMIFQHFNLLNAKTVAENICWPLIITGQYTQTQRTQRVNELLALVGLSAHRDQYPSQLSGGQKQRVGIARALANYPHMLLCDEATSALDPQTTQSILRLLLDINRELGLTIVLITHEMHVIRSICDRVAVIESGSIVESGTVAQVFLHPHHITTQSLVAQSHTLSEDNASLHDLPAGSQRVRLTFMGKAAYQPILSHVATATRAQITILQGTVGHIKDTPYGQLLIELGGTSQDIARALAAFDEQHVHHEVLQ